MAGGSRDRKLRAVHGSANEWTAAFNSRLEQAEQQDLGANRSDRFGGVAPNADISLRPTS